MKSSKKEYILILPDIRSALNVGAIFRTADAVGITRIFLVGVTPCPTDKFGRIQKDIAKAALGAETWIPWEYKKEIIPLLKKLKKDGATIVAIEQDKNSINYKKVKKTDNMVFFVGEETAGLPDKIKNLADIIAEIPMSGKKESLNVSVATGVALFQILG
ncbi:MAG: TrmH family RNA methyltransferase [Candidatus Nomurabacteria bacterium]|nr:TrmH family RNA methyltransferase [Candidatus Nomurabacteria bacterium]